MAVRMHYVLYSMKDLQRDMVKQGKDAIDDMRVALNGAVEVLARGLKADTPNARKSGRSWSPQWKKNRKKWGVLDQSIGRYPTRIGRLKDGESVGVNWGYLQSKRKKYFVSMFMNNGAFNVRSERFENYYNGYVQRSEQRHLPEAQKRYDEILSARMQRRLNNFNRKWSNKLYRP